nr:helix-turn-helix transcriptional regulator [Clostridia bacterium]
MQFESLFVDFDPRKLTKEHPFVPEGCFNNYYLLEKPEALHYHDFFEIGYCEKGSGLFYVDGEVISFSGPCCTIIYGGQIHIAQGMFPPNAAPDWNLWQFSYISLKHLFTDTDLMNTSRLKAMSAHKYDFPPLFHQHEDPILYDLIHAIIDETAHLGPGYLTAIRALTTALLTRHSRYMTPTGKAREDQDQIFHRLSDTLFYINQHYMEDVTIDDLLAASPRSSMSKSTLQRDMISFTGMSPMQYIHHLRMKRATIMLAGGMSVADVAFDVGYNTLSSFNRHFLKEYGLSPTQWKKRAQAENGST